MFKLNFSLERLSASIFGNGTCYSSSYTLHEGNGYRDVKEFFQVYYGKVKAFAQIQR